MNYRKINHYSFYKCFAFCNKGWSCMLFCYFMSLAHHKFIVKSWNLIINAHSMLIRVLQYINYFNKLFHKIQKVRLCINEIDASFCFTYVCFGELFILYLQYVLQCEQSGLKKILFMHSYHFIHSHTRR